jgi:hypothetical protein
MPPKWATRFELKNKPGTWIYVPTDEYREYGKAIKSAIEKKWRPPGYYFHLRAGGHISALKIHQINSYFSHLDIANFFGSISKSRTTRHLTKLFGFETARKYAEQSTVRNPNNRLPCLPFGFVQSSIIASLCLYKSALGKTIAQYAKSSNIEISVYVDDLILSSQSKQDLDVATNEIKIAAERSLFTLNRAKQVISSPKITAFNIELATNSLALTNDRLREFLFTFSSNSDEKIKKGILEYIQTVNPNQVTTFLQNNTKLSVCPLHSE